MQKVELSLERMLELFLHGRAFGVVDSKDEVYDILTRYTTEHPDQRVYVIENDTWTVGYSGGVLQPLETGLYRLWGYHDWLNCDNRNKMAVATQNQKHNEREEHRRRSRMAVRNSFVNNGILPGIVDMLLASNTDEQITALYNALPKEQQ